MSVKLSRLLNGRRTRLMTIGTSERLPTRDSISQFRLVKANARDPEKAFSGNNALVRTLLIERENPTCPENVLQHSIDKIEPCKPNATARNIFSGSYLYRHGSSVTNP